jgi:hypothetical protein
MQTCSRLQVPLVTFCLSHVLSLSRYEKPTYLFQQQALQFMPAVIDAFPISGIHYPDERICLFKVVLPVRP